MTYAYPFLLAALIAILALAAYVDRIYSEMGKFLAREYQDNIDAWTGSVEPRLHLGRESIALSASVLRQLTLAAIALAMGMRLYAAARPTASQIALAAFELVMIILIFDRLTPQLLFARTQGLWIVRIRFLLEALFYLVLPVTLLLGLLLSIAALAEPEETDEPEHPSEAMEALLEAGEEEGILEESDRDLVRSVVEFGDKVVREVMTPRPYIFAVPGTLTLEQFLGELKDHVFSRVPVYSTTLDNVTGIAFAHDLLQVLDMEAPHMTVAQIQRPAAFVPETKPVAELLREMQSEKQHMRVVIDEYGGVAGLVTIEDLLEAIVGNIADEHDGPEEDEAPIRQPDGSFIVPGSFEVSRLRELFAEPAEPEPPTSPGPADISVPHSSQPRRDEWESTQPVPHASQPHRDEWAATQSNAPSPIRTDPDPKETPTPRPHLYLSQDYEATTLGGLVSEIAGHIPHAGEVVADDTLRFEVLASTDRKVSRLRVSLIEEPAE